MFGRLLQNDLDDFVIDWNSHPIRPNSNLDSPCGCPSDIYDMPTLYGESLSVWLNDLDLLRAIDRKT